MITLGLIGIISYPVLVVINHHLIKRAGALRDEKYSDHVVIKDAPGINQSKSYFVGVAFITTMLIFLYYMRETASMDTFIFTSRAFDFTLGMALMQHTFAIAYNLNIIQIFRYAIQHPESISGKIEMSSQYIAHKAYCQLLFLGGIPLLLILPFQPSSFVIGCLAGILPLALNFWWRRRKSVS